MTAVLGNGAMAARISLEDKILVRVQVPQLDPLEIAGLCNCLHCCVGVRRRVRRQVEMASLHMRSRYSWKFIEQLCNPLIGKLLTRT